MKKQLYTALIGLAMCFSMTAQADDRLKPNQSIDEFTALAPSSTASGDYLLGFDDSANDWVKIDATAVNSSASVETVTSANTLTASECGKLVFISAAAAATTGVANTLPDATAGCEFEFVVSGASTTTYDTIITTGAELIKGLGFESETDDTEDGPTTAGADTISFVSTVESVGDRVKIVSDGTYWYAISFTSNDGGVTFSSAI